MSKLTLSMIIWGSLGIFALWSGLPALDLAFYRCLIGALILGIYCWQKGYLNYAYANFTNIFYAILSGIFIVLNWIFLFKSFQLASITIGNVSYYLQPIFLVILSIIFFSDSVKLKQWFFILLTTLGVMLTSNLNFETSATNQQLMLGVGCAVLAGILYAFSTVIIKFIKDMPAGLITLIQLIAGFIILMPFIKSSDILHLNQIAISNILIIGIIHTSLAYILYYQAVREVNLTMVAILSYIDPIVAIITDIIFCHRSLNWLQITGIVLTFIGSYQVIKLKQEKKYLQQEVAMS